MKVLILSGALIALSLASCRRGDSVTSVDSAARTAAQAGQNSVSNAAAQQPCVNLNTATAEELMRLPAIGEVIAQRIIEYRERHGRFRRPAEIIIIEGFSEKKYREIAGMICVE